MASLRGIQVILPVRGRWTKNNQDCQTPCLFRQQILQTAGLSDEPATQISEAQKSGYKQAGRTTAAGPDAAGEDESTCGGIFVEFMTKEARLEELTGSGNRLLVRFHQELEYFRRPQIPTESDVMNQILKSNCRDKTRSYLEAGCRLHNQNISNINQLCSCEDGLKNHISKAKALLEELECLVEDVYGITLTASLSALEISDSHSINNKLTTESCIMAMGGVSTPQEDNNADQLDSDVAFVTVMVIVRNMLKLDYTMQEKIVNALSLKTPSSELQGYCLMWDLRPFIEDNVMRLAWKMCP